MKLFEVSIETRRTALFHAENASIAFQIAAAEFEADVLPGPQQRGDPTLKVFGTVREIEDSRVTRRWRVELRFERSYTATITMQPFRASCGDIVPEMPDWSTECCTVWRNEEVGECEQAQFLGQPVPY